MFGDSLATAARVRVLGYGSADNCQLLGASELLAQNVTMEQWTISHRQRGKSHNSSHSISQHLRVTIMMSIFLKYSDHCSCVLTISDHCPLAAVSAHLCVAGPGLGPLCWLVCAGPLPHSQSFILILHQTPDKQLGTRSSATQSSTHHSPLMLSTPSCIVMKRRIKHSTWSRCAHCAL